MRTDRPRGRYAVLLGLLFGLFGVEGAIGLYVLGASRRSGDRVEQCESVGLRTDELGMALNNWVKQMKVSTGLSQAVGTAAPLPPTKPLTDRARRLRTQADTVRSAGLSSLLAGTDVLVARISSYYGLLARREFDDATLLYIRDLEPLADRLLEVDFPAAREEILREVERLSSQDREAGRIARQLLLGSLAAPLAVGVLPPRLIRRTLAEASSREKELERRNSEMAIARTIQTSVIPRDLSLRGFDVAAVMVPAAEVGGDFYEFRKTSDGGAWLGIGDVTGHGITAGLVMMMAQAMFTTLTESGAEDVGPSRFLAQLNRALFFNLKSRLGEERFMTMVVARLYRDGRLVYAGAHTDLLVYRHATGSVERHATDGLWLGLVPEIGPATKEHEVVLERGDLALFHTDGVTEARNRNGEPFDIRRVADRLVAAPGSSAEETVTSILQAACAWAPLPDDDISLMAVRRS